MGRYFHVDRVRGRLKADQVIQLVYPKMGVDGCSDKANLYTCMFPAGVSLHGWQYLLCKDRPRPSEDRMGLIEVLAEEIRRLDYGGRVSRFQSFFAFHTVEEAERFIRMYPVTLADGREACQGDIWEVEGDDVRFESDMRRLSLGDCWLDALVNLHAYWQGRFTSDALCEVLLRPPVRIVRKVNGLTIE